MEIDKAKESDFVKIQLIKPAYAIQSQTIIEDIPKIIEKIGRVCFKPEDKITENSSEDFLRKIMKRKHLSVIEHVNMTVRFICDRGVSHELVRHRLASYSQESTRYCDDASSTIQFIIPCWFQHYKEREWDEKKLSHERNRLRFNTIAHGGTPYDLSLSCWQEYAWIHTMWEIASVYTRLVREAKWSAQQARSVLPNAVKTEIVMTANLREWLHVFTERCSAASHPQMRELMVPLRAHFSLLLPQIFHK